MVVQEHPRVAAHRLVLFGGVVWTRGRAARPGAAGQAIFIGDYSGHTCFQRDVQRRQRSSPLFGIQ